MERRLAEIPTEEWGDVQVDITPREYVLDYLAHSFPVQLYEPFTDSEGNLSSRPVYRDGQPVESREAVARRDRLIEKLASLPPVPGALDQIVQRFGTEMVAEVTGRSRRIIRKGDRLMVENRAGSANLAETAAFMDDDQAHPRLLRRRRHRAQLPCRALGAEPPAARPLPARTRLEGRRRDPGAWPHQPHQPGPAAAVPADRDRRQGREALSLARSRAASTRWAPSPAASARPAARACSGPRTISKAIMGATRCASSTCFWCSGKVEGCSLQTFEDATGLQAHGRQRPQGRAAADHHVPQPAAGADHRPAERPVHRLRAVAHCAHRGRDRVGDL